ncbi:MAG: hypothetical protein ACRDOO_21620 [Actinomadura sp.]
MLRKSFVIMFIVPLALCSCGGRATETLRPGARPSTVGAAPPGAYAESTTPAACPTKATRKFAKTRFVANAGLAAGAFKRYIYTPYRNNAFKSGAPDQKKAIIKAGLAGAFALDQLRRAKNNVMADPTLCKVLAGPVTKLSALTKSMVDKLKKGQIDPSDIGSVSGGIEGFRKTAGGAGAGFKDRTPPAGVIGGG